MNAEKIFGENVYVNLDEVIETVYQCRREEANDEWVKRWLEPLKNLPTIEVSEDYISKAYLEQEIENHLLSTANLRTEKDEWWNKAFEVMVEIIENAPSVVPKPKEGEWIPCSERLPEEREWIGTKKFGTTISDEVLVTFESRGERFVRPIHFQNGELGGMDKHTMDAVHGEWKAVAWMPLPTPWKGADDE